MEVYAETVLWNGNVVQMNESNSTVSALAICGGRIAAAGTKEEVFPWAGPDTRVIDLQGKTVIPGINDSHMHLPIAGLRCLGYSPEEYLRPAGEWTYEKKKEAVLAALDYLRRLGVTSITEGELGTRGHGMRGNIADQDVLSILNDLHNEGRLTTRINLMVSYGNKHDTDSITFLEEMLPRLGFHSGFGDPFLRIAGLKLFADGCPAGGDACTREPYLDGHRCGLKVTGKTEEERHDQLVSMIRYGHRYGYTVGIHCTGDQAIDTVADGFLANCAGGEWEARDYFIHGEMITKDCLERVKGKPLGYSALFSAVWLTGGPEEMLGKERGQAVFPARSAMEAGLTVTGHTDYPFLPADWRECVEAAVTRTSREGKVTGPDQAVSVTDALRMFTINGAWQTHEESLKGSIEVGKYADLCVLQENILEIPAEQIHNVTVVGSVVDGKIVWWAEENTAEKSE